MREKNYKFWFATGSQELYGKEVLEVVKNHTTEIVKYLNEFGNLPYEVVEKPVLVDSKSIKNTFDEANIDEECVGVITWMHTFSPAKSWIAGLQAFNKPLLHLHTQFNEEIPYDNIDMNFMNTNQSAHGDREFAHIFSRLNIYRKIIVGYWKDKEVLKEISDWMITALGIVESKNIRVLRIGDNMRNVAVTEGDKVEAQIKFGWQVDSYDIEDINKYIKAVSEEEINNLVEEYYKIYDISLEGRDEKEFRDHVAVQAAMEIGIERFMIDNNYHAIVTNFEMISEIDQLPGLAVQRLMEKGYGFGAEGDWKTAAMVRMMKIMTDKVKNRKGTSFLEDYTYNFIKGEEGILESHMLEVCPSIADKKPQIKVSYLSMGDKEDPARLVFTSKTGKAIATSLIDLGHRFRLLINEVECKELKKEMPKLPVASVYWTPSPNLKVGAEAWLLAGGAHHTAFTYDLSKEQMIEWAEYMGIEYIVIDENTTIPELKKELRLNEVYYKK